MQGGGRWRRRSAPPGHALRAIWPAKGASALFVRGVDAGPRADSPRIVYAARVPLVRAALTAFFRGVTGIFFRDVEVAFAPPAATRGRLFAGNHVNGIVDPVVVLTQAPFPISPVAKSTLWKIPVFRTLLDAVGAVPVTRKKDDPGKSAGGNDEVFDRVATHLGSGGNILIFPEGVSHNEPHLVPLKTGPARMLARARERGARGLTFQAVALEFDARESFRSRALLVFGPVRELDAIELEGEALVQHVTAVLRDDLSELVVEGRTWADRTLVARVAELLAHDSGDRSLAQWNAIGRQVEAARARVDDERLARVRAEVDAYYAMLARSRVKDDHVVAAVPARPGRLLRALGLLAVAPLAALGAVLFFLPYQLPKLAERLAGDERDVVSTYKLGIGLCAFPLWAVGLAVAAALTLPPPERFFSVPVLLVSPLATLFFLDRLDPVRAQWATAPDNPFVGPTRLEHLREQRARAMAAIGELREELGV